MIDTPNPAPLAESAPTPPTTSSSGTVVAENEGQVLFASTSNPVRLPKFAAGEELFTLKLLEATCPDEVAALLDRKDSRKVYDAMISALKSSKRSLLTWRGAWRSEPLLAVVSRYVPLFQEKGIGVSACRLSKTGGGSRCWLEFVDLSTAPEGYVSQYDVSRLDGGETFSTLYSKIKLPKGVATEKIKTSKQLKDKVPDAVAEILDQRGARAEYDALIDAIVNTSGGKLRGWKTNELENIVLDYQPRFAMKDIGIFLCRVEEYVSHGQYGSHVETIRWLEFADLTQVPNYRPTRGEVGMTEDKTDCIIL